MNYEPNLYKAAYYLLEALKSGANDAERKHIYQALESLGRAEIEALEQIEREDGKASAPTANPTAGSVPPTEVNR
jgi:hypothetical protein